MANVQLLRNVGLNDAATSTSTSNVGEPSTATSGNNVFVTGNWYASMSRNNGTSWSFVNPFTTLPAAAGGFCCDQLVLFDTSRNIWVWILQYITKDGNNVFRVAISRDASFGSWYWWDFNPRSLNASWTDLWFDYPDAAFSANHLYLTFNAFNGAGNWQRAFVFKLPLATLASGGALGYNWWSTTTHGSLRLTQGGAANMFFASHNGGRNLKVFSWPDASPSVSSFEVTTAPWSRGPYSAAGPGGLDWLGRTDSRITGAWNVGDEAGFMWTASPQAGRPRPYVKVVTVNTATRAITGQPDIWNDQSAFAYPAAAPNVQGVVGVSMFFGGGTRHPGHVVGFREGAAWRLALSRVSTHSPADNKWGDYVSVRRHAPGGTGWVAAGYTHQSGNLRQHVEPQYVHFGQG